MTKNTLLRVWLGLAACGVVAYGSQLVVGGGDAADGMADDGAKQRHQAVAEANSDRQPTALVAQPAANHGPVVQKWQPGTQDAFQVQLVDKGWYDLQHLMGATVSGQSTFETTFSGRVLRTALGQSGEYLVQFLDVSVEIIVDDQPEYALMEALSQQLQRGLRATITSSGHLSQLLYPPVSGQVGASDQFIREYSRQLVQSIHAQGSPQWQNRWRTQETDAHGAYEAVYDYVGLQGNNPQLWLIHKETAHYSKPALSATGMAKDLKTYIEPTGQLALVYNADLATFVSLAGSRQVALINRLSGARFGGNQSQTTVSHRSRRLLSHQEVSQLNAYQQQTFAGAKSYRQHQEQAAQVALTKIYQDDLGTATSDGLRDELMALAEAATAADLLAKQRDLYPKLKAWVFLNPDQIATFYQDLAGVTTDHPAWDSLLKALTAIGSPEAQAAMGTMLKDHIAHDAFAENVITSIGLLATPTQALEEVLRAEMTSDRGDRRQQVAHLAMGMVAYHLNEAEDASSKRRLNEIMAAAASNLAQAMEPREIRLHLAMIGNAGVNATVTLLESYLDHEDLTVRSEAVMALRLTSTPQTLPLLSKLATDTIPAVQAAAIESLAFQPAGPQRLNAEAKILAGLKDPALRTAVIENIFRQGVVLKPAVIATLEEAAANETNSDLKAHIHALLANLTVAG